MKKTIIQCYLNHKKNNTSEECFKNTIRAILDKNEKHGEFLEATITEINSKIMLRIFTTKMI